MEYIQILLNVVILGGLAVFVLREAAGKYASQEDVQYRCDSITKWVQLQNGETIREAERISYSMKVGDPPALKQQPTEAELYTRLGSELTDKAYQSGTKIIIEALAREGRLSRAPMLEPREKRGPVVMDEFSADVEKEDDNGLPDVVRRMNERMGVELAMSELKAVRDGV
jgi:hypothetical protein